jgi:hypothetical protein
MTKLMTMTLMLALSASPEQRRRCNEACSHARVLPHYDPCPNTLVPDLLCPQVRALKKKLRSILLLKQSRRKGIELDVQQLSKLQGEEDVKREIESFEEQLRFETVSSANVDEQSADSDEDQVQPIRLARESRKRNQEDKTQRSIKKRPQRLLKK